MLSGYVRARLAKPCPMCGSKHIITIDRDKFDRLGFSQTGYSSIECDNCGLEICNSTMKDSTYGESYKAVLKLWNRRAA